MLTAFLHYLSPPCAEGTSRFPLGGQDRFPLIRFIVTCKLMATVITCLLKRSQRQLRMVQKTLKSRRQRRTRSNLLRSRVRELRNSNSEPNDVAHHCAGVHLEEEALPYPQSLIEPLNHVDIQRMMNLARRAYEACRRLPRRSYCVEIHISNMARTIRALPDQSKWNAEIIEALRVSQFYL